MIDAQTHLAEIYTRLSLSPIVASFTVLESRDARDQGYFRARITLTNREYLELAEYFVVMNGKINAVRYRYQWMDTTSALKRRWDNAKHHPGILNFPHPVHTSSEDCVEPGAALNVVELLTLLEQELTDER